MNSAPLAVYDGRRRLGDVRQRPDGRFEAITAEGKKLGLFNKLTAAAEALAAELVRA